MKSATTLRPEFTRRFDATLSEATSAMAYETDENNDDDEFFKELFDQIREQTFGHSASPFGTEPDTIETSKEIQKVLLCDQGDFLHYINGEPRHALTMLRGLQSGQLSEARRAVVEIVINIARYAKKNGFNPTPFSSNIPAGKKFIAALKDVEAASGPLFVRVLHFHDKVCPQLASTAQPDFFSLGSDDQSSLLQLKDDMRIWLDSCCGVLREDARVGRLLTSDGCLAFMTLGENQLAEKLCGAASNTVRSAASTAATKRVGLAEPVTSKYRDEL